ncbi:hypothetical protein SISNIDRAFT_265215 [Sistotremastrum niveocremeum HHB9708]|uniref:F-box domain-containing protein n=1 Tax=Sistotremastrum niveocremeum HHB9708 TaxID=1314777 RepID=A0A164P6A2_9AGAM|nr:hypothetical protein SISNIDRAFT_265215 [Sistotremastrum niveocremeum HHB9708]
MPREPPGAQLSLLQLLDALKCRITKEILKEVHKPVMHETDVQFTYRTRQRISSIKRQVMTSLDAVLAPHMNQSLFNRLPDELLSEIFLWNVEACSEPSEWMPIMRVCKRWRRIAQNTPRLWGTVNIRWPRKILHQFLHHHRNAPLHVSIRDDVKWSMDAMTRFSFRARSFIANLDHMESLQIHLPNREYLELYLL